VRALPDPNTAPLRALPREDRELFIAASNGHVLAFDNVSGLPARISGTLCRLATGGGFAVRQLSTEQDEARSDPGRRHAKAGRLPASVGPVFRIFYEKTDTSLGLRYRVNQHVRCKWSEHTTSAADIEGELARRI
jgi:hypothetical protein